MRARLTLARLGVTLAAAVIVASPAAAQPSDESDAIARARDAAAEGRFVEARDLLRGELDRAPRPAVAYNLSLMYRETGELTLARDTLTALLSNDFGPLPDEPRARAAQLLGEVTAGLATLVMTVTEGEAQLEVDGRIAGVGRPGQPVRHAVDPGPHSVVARWPDGEDRRMVDATRGESIDVALALPRAAPLPDRPADAPLDDDPDDGEDLTALWVVLGVLGAGAVAGAIAAGVVLGGDGSEPAAVPDGYVGRFETLLAF